LLCLPVGLVLFEAETSPPDFSSNDCQRGALEDIDPQGRLIWVQTNVPLSQTQGLNGEPLSLYVSGKMSSEVYLNGVYIGQNGMPGSSSETEIPGRMDAELFPPQSLFRVGDNEVVIRASAYNGVVKLKRPIHLIGIAPAGVYANGILPRFGPALITLGVFLLGGLYFGVTALINTSRISSLTLSAVCVFAAGQLISEALRGLIPYTYPIHDLRLLAITTFSAAFGLSVAFHIFRTFNDYKALGGMLSPLLAGLLATGLWSYQRRPRAFLYFISLLVFVASMVTFQGLFLDTVFFLLVAFFLMLLFVDQALTFAEEARERRSEEARANQLEQALAEVEERAETNHINVKSAGKMERIATSQIVHCKGAGGYSEIVLVGGRTILHTAALSELEEMLPATFLRVHRSHLINVMYVKTLSRDPSGTGTLELSEGEDVPVSRRIMPKVRQALA